MASREAIYGTDVHDKSEAGVRQEYSMDLGYRGVMHARLGAFLCKTDSDSASASVAAGPELEEFATALHI